MQHLEGSGMPVLYIGRTVPKGQMCGWVPGAPTWNACVRLLQS
jgi:hypothetical protein